jgi:hypothetical protein
VGRPEGKMLFGITRHRWEDNIKVHLKEIGRKGVDWIDLAQGHVTGFYGLRIGPQVS